MFHGRPRCRAGQGRVRNRTRACFRRAVASTSLVHRTGYVIGDGWWRVAVFSASDVIHPFDEAAKRQLESMTGLQATVQAFMKVYSEREAHNFHLSECLRFGPKQLPEIYRLLPPICDAFGIPEPELYLAMGDVNAYTFGHTRTSIVIFSELLDHLAPDEIEAVIAHECGHILLKHVLYHSMAQFLDAAREIGAMAPIPGLSALLTLASVPVQSALTSWSHKSELSADRAAAAYMGRRRRHHPSHVPLCWGQGWIRRTSIVSRRSPTRRWSGRRCASRGGTASCSGC